MLIRQSVQLWVGCISGALSINDYERILKEVGFTGIEITPVNIYTKDMIKNMAEAENLNDLYAKLDENAVDGAFAGAHVKAYK